MPIVTMFVEFVLFVDGKVHHKLLICPDWSMSFFETVPLISENNGLLFLIFLLFVHHFFTLILLLPGLLVQRHMQI